MLRFQNHLRIFLFQNAKILRIPIKSLFLESYEIPILRISYKKGSLLKVRTSHRRVTDDYRQLQTSHIRVTDG